MSFNFANGFTFNGTHSSAFPLLVNASQRQVAPPIEPITLEIPGKAGALDYGYEIGTREISVQITLWGDNAHDYRKHIRDIAGWLLPSNRKPKQLVFDDEPDKYYLARLSGNTDLADLWSLGTVTLTFFCADPYIYSVIAPEDRLWGNEVLTFESTAYTYGDTPNQAQSFTSAGIMTVEAKGNVAQRPTIKVEGSATSLTISTGGKSFTLSAFTDKTISVNGPGYTVTYADNSNALRLFSGDFLELLPGVNDIAVSGTGIDVTVTVIFHDTFL